jgi:hypothetical protein
LDKIIPTQEERSGDCGVEEEDEKEYVKFTDREFKAMAECQAWQLEKMLLGKKKPKKKDGSVRLGSC